MHVRSKPTPSPKSTTGHLIKITRLQIKALMPVSTTDQTAYIRTHSIYHILDIH